MIRALLSSRLWFAAPIQVPVVQLAAPCADASYKICREMLTVQTEVQAEVLMVRQGPLL